jgi:alpha-tubulin suppressor-like RCC1 family protein
MKPNRKRGRTCRWSRVVCGFALVFLLYTLAIGGTWAVAVTNPDEAFVSAIAAGTEHALALTRDGSVWTWGGDGWGQLGGGIVNSNAKRWDPPPVLTGAMAIATGGGSYANWHSIVIMLDGSA